MAAAHRPVLMPPCGHPGFHDIDAGGNCRFVGCNYNTDLAIDAAVSRGENPYATGWPDDDFPAPTSDEED